RAIDGFTEDVWFHGEVVGQRRRFDTRLLLAHLGRLDRLEDNADVTALADDFDDVLARIRDGEDLPPAIENWVENCVETRVEAVPETPPASSSGPCNKRSMSPDAAAPSARPEPSCDCPGPAHGSSHDRPHYTMSAEGPVPTVNTDGDGPCCDRPDWPACAECPHFPPIARLFHRMEDARPDHAPAPQELGDPGEVEARQMDAFMAGDPDWWRYGEDFVPYRRNDCDKWMPALPEADAAQEEEAQYAEEGEPVPA
ncbi:MAG: hypothetical protein WA948_12720, partial [Pontixanthobacter sp.]